MQKKIFRVFSLLVVLAVICESSIYAMDTGNRFALNASTPLTASQTAKANAANTAYSNLITAFYEEYIGPKAIGQNTESMEAPIPTAYTVNGIPAEGYPEYYAGAYLNANYELVILVTENSASTKKALCDQAKDSSIVFQEVSYSYPELISCMDDITRHWSAGDEEYQPIKYAYIDDHGNRVVVGCTEYYNDEYLSFLRENLPRFYVIAFVACDDFGEEAISLETTINGYTELCSYTSSTIPDDVEQFPCFSYGCKAKKVVNGTTKYGFITAGHAVNVGEYVFPTPPSLYSPIGTCTNSIYQPNLGVDAAFVERSDASYTLSTGIPSQPTYTLSTTYSYAMQGDPILKCGKETLETPGTVVIASFSILIVGTYYYMDMALTNYHSLQGDSGGLVYSLDEATGIATPMGIHSTAIAPVQLQTWNITPSYSPNWDGNYKLYCKMYYALSYLGVSLSS